MSKEYKQETVKKYEKQIDKLLETAPGYVKEFYHYICGDKLEITTRSAYIRDILHFIKYLNDNISANPEEEIKKIPIITFQNLTIEDMTQYHTWLREEQKLADSSIKKKFAALIAFYKFATTKEFISNNPMEDFVLPAPQKKKLIKLDATLSKRLLDGILRNDLYLATTQVGEIPLPIPEKVYVKREPLVLRNYAICCLFLGAGLRVSELVGLDLSDINFEQGSLNILAKGGDEVQVYFGKDVERALKTYLNGVAIPNELNDKYHYKENDAFVWCQNHKFDIHFKDKLQQDFPNREKSFYSDMELLISAMRRQGRASLRPVKNCNAVFISSRGQRMSVRMVELMIKEMVRTYLPEYDDADIFSPHKLRTTCATRILTQTSDIQLASTQLNYKGTAIPSAFFAELQKEKQKDKIRNLNMHQW